MNRDMPEDPREELIAIAREFHARGWMPGTAGNLSARAGDDFWITASGRSKGRLTVDDFVRVDRHGVARETVSHRKPSAETSLHAAAYEIDPSARACLHVHSVCACLVSARVRGPALRLPAIEMIKAFDIWSADPKVDLPLFENHADVSRIAADVRRAFGVHRPTIPAFLVRGHGITVWGPSLEHAYHRVEALEFLLEVLERSSGREMDA
ncbi:MAG: methylthioribulose 1-phosphate dehydratase [Acidiferrobacteraceae bacterium]